MFDEQAIREEMLPRLDEGSIVTNVWNGTATFIGVCPVCTDILSVGTPVTHIRYDYPTQNPPPAMRSHSFWVCRDREACRLRGAVKSD